MGDLTICISAVELGFNTQDSGSDSLICGVSNSDCDAQSLYYYCYFIFSPE